MSLIRSGNIPSFSGNVYDEVYQILGAVSDNRWESMESGAKIEVTDDDTRARLWKCQLRCKIGLGAENKLPPIDDCPTELFPNGIPHGAGFIAKMRSELAVRPASDTHRVVMWDIPTFVGMMHGQVAGMGRLAGRLLGTGPDAIAKFLDTYKLIPCARLATDVSLEFSPNISIARTFLDVGQEVGPPGVLSALPEEYRRAALEEWRRLEAKQLLPGSGGR